MQTPPSTPYTPQGLKILAAIGRAGLTRRLLAAALNVDPKTVRRWLSQDSPLWPEKLAAIAAACGVNVTDLEVPGESAAVSTTTIEPLATSELTHPWRWLAKAEAQLPQITDTWGSINGRLQLS